MMTSPEDSPRPDAPAIPLDALVDWFNEQAADVDERAAALRDPVKTPTPKTVAGAAALIGELGGVEERQRVLRDLKGFLIAQSALAAGNLDHVPELFAGDEDGL